MFDLLVVMSVVVRRDQKLQIVNHQKQSPFRRATVHNHSTASDPPKHRQRAQAPTPHSSEPSRAPKTLIGSEPAPKFPRVFKTTFFIFTV